MAHFTSALGLIDLVRIHAAELCSAQTQEQGRQRDLGSTLYPLDGDSLGMSPTDLLQNPDGIVVAWTILLGGCAALSAGGRSDAF